MESFSSHRLHAPTSAEVVKFVQELTLNSKPAKKFFVLFLILACAVHYGFFFFDKATLAIWEQYITKNENSLIKEIAESTTNCPGFINSFLACQYIGSFLFAWSAVVFIVNLITVWRFGLSVIVQLVILLVNLYYVLNYSDIQCLGNTPLYFYRYDPYFLRSLLLAGAIQLIAIFYYEHQKDVTSRNKRNLELILGKDVRH